MDLKIVSYSAPAPVTIIFFFQAEDGIRDLTVTGVQTCALPILSRKHSGGKDLVIVDAGMNDLVRPSHYMAYHEMVEVDSHRSEERRVGKECRSRWSP